MTVATAMPKPAVRIDLVQVLRALAAVMIVFGHSQSAVASLAAGGHVRFARSTLLPWGGSVDLFFVISGFIMVYASQRLFARPGGAREFLRRRLVRVAPLYWVCTSAYLGIVLLAHARGDPRTFSLPAIFASYLFLPFRSFGAHGGEFPLLDLGWTLNYEMFFYVLFALAIGLRRWKAVAAIVAALLALTAAGLVFQFGGAAPRFWTRPIVLDFGLGVLVAHLRCSGMRWRSAVRWSLLALGVAVFVLDPLKLFSQPLGVTTPNGLARVLTSGLPAAAVLAAAVLGPDIVWRPLAPVVVLGNASYSLYLVHPFVLIAVEKLAVRTDLVARSGGWPIVLAAVTLSVGAAFAAFHLVEEPLTRLGLTLTRRLTQDRTPVTAAAPLPIHQSLKASP